MIISKTPMRLSFVGGGSDIPHYYREHGGAVLSTSINKFVYLTVNKRFGPGFRISYSKTEEVDQVEEIGHKIVRNTLLKLALDGSGQHGGIEITSIADIPSRGSGLGSSSAFTVGLLHALYAYLGRYRPKLDLASEACDIEINRCGEPIGKQDQYACACGGLNVITFHPDDSVTVEPVIARPEVVKKIESELLMFHTGVARSASDLLKVQAETVTGATDKQKSLDKMVNLVFALRDGISTGDATIVGDVLHENWMIKRSLSAGITNALIDDAYETARRAGARGGKLLGAGGGGFLVFSAPQERHEAIIARLAPLVHVDFGFDVRGATIVFYQPS
jgi:D-glycero-alpha-D-manno-heptose-7-phosphate kinase